LGLGGTTPNNGVEGQRPGNLFKYDTLKRSEMTSETHVLGFLIIQFFLLGKFEKRDFLKLKKKTKKRPKISKSLLKDQSLLKKTDLATLHPPSFPNKYIHIKI
jgi:hypothetical protein